MKLRTLAGVAASLAASTVSLASVEPGRLGAVDATIDYCTQVNIGHDGAYKNLKTKVVGSITLKDQQALAASAAYQQQYNSIGLILRSLPVADGLKACRNALTTPPAP